MNLKTLISASFLFLGAAIAANTLVDLSQVKDVVPFQKINATIQIAGKPNVKFEYGKYQISAGRLEWMIEKSYDGTFATQKKIDLEYFESKKVIEEKPNLVIYESGLLGIKSISFLYYTKVSGGVFCRTTTSKTTLAEARAMIKACETITTKK